MPILNSSTRAQQRRQASETLDQVCYLVTPGTMTGDGAGGETEGTPTSTQVDCRVAPPNALERVIADRLSQEVDATITLEHANAVAATQRITGPDGESYEVVHSNTTPGESYRTATRVLVRRIR